jgi:hypothetical protein
LLGVGHGADNPTQAKQLLSRNLRKLKLDRSARDDIAKKVALNRDEWAKLLKKASAHQGLSSQ